MRNLYHLTIVLICAVAFCGCNDDDENPFVGTDNYISSWDVVLGEENYAASIAGNEITLTVPDGTDLSGAKHQVSICEHAILAPDPNTIESWDSEQTFTVTSFTGEKREYKFNIRYSAISVSGGITLNSQSEVDAYASSKVSVIDGVLRIAVKASDDPIENVDALSGITEITGGLIIGKEYKGENIIGFPNLQSVGSLNIKYADIVNNIELNGLKSIKGDVVISNNEPLSTDIVESISCPYLEMVGGDISVSSQKYNFNSLKHIGNTCTIQNAVIIDFPSLQHVGGEIKMEKVTNLKTVNLPELTECESLSIPVGAKDAVLDNVSVPKLTEVPGRLCVYMPTGFEEFLAQFTKIGTLEVWTENVRLDLSKIELQHLTFSDNIVATGCSIITGSDEMNFDLDVPVGMPDMTGIKKINGDVTLHQKGILVLDGIEEIHGTFNIEDGRQIGQYGYVIGLNAPELRIVGSVVCNPTSGLGQFICPKLETIDGDIQFKLHSTNKEFVFDIPALKTITGKLTIHAGMNSTWGKTFTNLDAFSNLEIVSAVTVMYGTSLTSFAGLKKAAESITDENNWETKNNSFNPTLADMKAGKTEITDFN